MRRSKYEWTNIAPILYQFKTIKSETAFFHDIDDLKIECNWNKF